MKKSYLKPESDAWFYLQCMIFSKDMMGMGEKTQKKTYIHEKQGKNPPFGFPPIPPVYKIGGLLFSGSKETGNKPDLP